MGGSSGYSRVGVEDQRRIQSVLRVCISGSGPAHPQL